MLFTVACANSFAENWVKITTDKGNVFHVDADAFPNDKAFWDYVKKTAEGLDLKRPDGSYQR